VRFILFGSLKNYLNLSGFRVHLDLSNGNSIRLWRSSRLIKRKLHHRLWRLPYTEVLVCHKQRVEVIPANLSFGIRARFLVQVCLSFNIFHPFVSLPYRSIFVCSCDVTSSSYFEILFYYSQKLVTDPEKKKKKKKKKKNEKRERLVEKKKKMKREIDS
jgi:hypothetical protein